MDARQHRHDGVETGFKPVLKCCEFVMSGFSNHLRIGNDLIETGLRPVSTIFENDLLSERIIKMP